MQISPFSADAAGPADSRLVPASLTDATFLLTQTLGSILCNLLAIYVWNWHASNRIYAIALLPIVLLQLLLADTRTAGPAGITPLARALVRLAIAAARAAPAAALRSRPSVGHAEPP